MQPFTTLSVMLVAVISPALINAQLITHAIRADAATPPNSISTSTVTVVTMAPPPPSGMGCVCMAPTSSGKDESMRDRTQNICQQQGAFLRGTLDFYGRGNFYCNFVNGIDSAKWDQSCRTIYGDGTYGFCNAAN